MDVFKLRLSDKIFYVLTKESFEEKTEKSQPWYSKNDSIESYYAICPSCENTIEIIGLYKGDRLYGRHYLKNSVKGLGNLDRDAYEFCPRANNRKALNKDLRRSLTSNIGAKIKELLIEQFDRVIYILNKQLPIRLTKKIIISMLEYYKKAEGWLYRGATLENIPWTFIYIGGIRHSLFKTVINDLELRKELLKRYKSAYFGDDNVLLQKEGEKTFIDAGFCLMHHKRDVIDHELSESIVFSVSDYNRDTIYRKKIDFDHLFFNKLIEKDTYRNMFWVELCRENLL